MSFAIAQPEILSASAGTLQDIGCSVSTGSAAAAIPTTALVPAAGDEVSALTARQFAAHGQLYQAVSAQAAAVHAMMVQALQVSAGSYSATEAANAAATS